MGISGLYTELGPGERIAFAKYAADHCGATGRRLRIAVDASIWSFQVQASKGGVNPALRTLYYRLVRLLSLNVTPLFVFDGPGRPTFKRNHKTHTDFTPAQTRLTKKLLKHFGFPHITAPGEAEAECAALQKAGIVDAVMSEDVDTLMFGSGITLRNWSAEGPRNKTPTHITVYDGESIATETGLKPSGMVLVALMRGGDYLPDGISGCGIKIAVEAAKAGFGEDLCVLADGDKEGLREWRERLQHELVTNDSGWFGRRHKTVKIPSDFPSREVLGYYKSPVVSSQKKIEKLRGAIEWENPLDVVALRELTRDSFEWRGTPGAFKFVRTLAPALLANWLYSEEKKSRDVVDSFHGRREHFSTDACKELRVSFVPINVVPINKTLEEDDDQAEAAEQAGVLDDDEPGEDSQRKVKEYSPYMAERIWILECFVRKTLSEAVEEWELGTKSKKTTRATIRKNAATVIADASDAGAITRYFPVSNPNSATTLRQPTPSGLNETSTRSKKGPRKATKKQDLPRSPESAAYASPSTRLPSAVRAQDGKVALTQESSSQSCSRKALQNISSQRDTYADIVEASKSSLPYPSDPKLGQRPSTPQPNSPVLPSLQSTKYSPTSEIANLIQTITLSSSPENAQQENAPTQNCASTTHSPKRQRTPRSGTMMQESPRTASVMKQIELISLDSSPGESPAVNRVLDFSAHSSPAVNVGRRSRCKKEQTIKELFPTSPLRELQTNLNTYPTTPLETLPPSLKHTRNKQPSNKLRVALRDSLPGAWEILDEGMVSWKSQNVWEDVEVIDLTNA